MIMLTARLTLRASYLPLPPFCSSPFSHSLSLITVLVAPAHGIHGCFNTTSFDKNYCILILRLTLFVLLFSSLLLSRTFSQFPLPKIPPPFFCQSSIHNLFSRFFLCYNFYFSLMNMPITCIEEIETTLLTLFGRIFGFIEGIGR